MDERRATTNTSLNTLFNEWIDKCSVGHPKTFFEPKLLLHLYYYLLNERERPINYQP